MTLKNPNSTESLRDANRVVFVVPFFLNGDIVKVRVYSDVKKAQGALRRYVGFGTLLADIKQANPTLSARQANLDAYGAIDRTPFAGSFVYEVRIDSRDPVRKSKR